VRETYSKNYAGNKSDGNGRNTKDCRRTVLATSRTLQLGGQTNEISGNAKRSELHGLTSFLMDESEEGRRESTKKMLRSPRHDLFRTRLTAQKNRPEILGTIVLVRGGYLTSLCSWTHMSFCDI
jgi:hypothetical protein